MNSIFKIQDINTGLFWDGYWKKQSTNKIGKIWKTRKGLEHTLYSYLHYMNTTKSNILIPNNWQVIEIEIIENPKNIFDLSYINRHFLIREEINKRSTGDNYYNNDNSFCTFYKEMTAKKIIDKIQFIFKLKSSKDAKFNSMRIITEARAQLRLLGIKTRSFYENNGYFGMIDKDQALKARMSLDVDEFIDLQEIRNFVENKNKS